MPLNHLAGFGVDDFRALARLCGGFQNPAGFGKLIRGYQPPSLHADFEGAGVGSMRDLTVQLL